MNDEDHFKVVSVAAWCAWHTLEESRKFGRAVGEAIRQSDRTVMVLASGSLSHRFQDNADAEEGIHSISREFYRQVDLRVVDLWKRGQFKDFIAMLPEYAKLCEGEGGMHDTAMLLGRWAGTPRQAGRDRDRLFPELRHGADQRDFPGAVAGYSCALAHPSTSSG